MQIANTFPKGMPPQGGMSDIASQLGRQQKRHQRILKKRAVRHWLPFVLLIVLGSIVAGVVSQFIFAYPIYVLGPILALVIFYLMAWRVELGLLILAIGCSPFLPQAFQAKSVQIYPAIPLLIWLFCVLLVLTAFNVRKPVLPSFRVIWPLLGLLVLAVISNIIVQLTWTAGVAHKINSTPILYSELYGVALFLLPLTVIVVTTVALTEKDHWIEYILNALQVLAVLLAVIVTIQFKRIDATIYTFRFTEPKLGWMSLKSIAQLLSLGAILGYARFLYATRGRRRILHGIATLLCLVGVYFTLQNSWWLEVGIAFLVMTFAYSRRLFLFYCVLALPFLPFLKVELSKLATVKSADFYRLIIWQDALRVWSKQPLLGVGPGNFWAFDERFTQLPKYLRQFNKTGLGVSHNGYLQMLAELGPIGISFYLLFMIIMIVIAVQLYRHSKLPKKPASGILKWLELNLSLESEKRSSRILGLIGLGLICGSAVGDFFSGAFFLQPRQFGSAGGLPQVMTSWIVWGCVIYKDQLWRTAHKWLKIER
jgi:O-antigen ligase